MCSVVDTNQQQSNYPTEVSEKSKLNYNKY